MSTDPATAMSAHRSLLACRHPSLANVAGFLLIDSTDRTTQAFAEFAAFLLTAIPNDTAEFSVAMRKLLECRDAISRSTEAAR